MKHILKPSLPGLLALALLAAASAAAHAQTPIRHERILVARAGVVNFVSGSVEYNHEGETAWRALTDKDELKSGDAVKTGAGGRAEVLLNPGSYFRLGELSQFEMTDASLDNLRLKLSSGSAIVEATGYNKLDLSIAIETPQTRVVVVRTGIYRINVLASGVTEVAVWKGRALVGEKAEVVKAGRVVRVGASGEVLVAKLDKKERDAFDFWSRERGRELAKLNERLGRDSRARLTLAGFNTFDPFGFDSTRLYGGMWVRYGDCYTFLPYSSSWRSPYGHSYGSWYFAPRACQLCPSGSGGVVVGNGGQGSGYGSGSGTGSGSGSGYGGNSGGSSGGGSSNSGGGSVAPPPPPVRTFEPPPRPDPPARMPERPAMPGRDMPATPRDQ